MKYSNTFSTLRSNCCSLKQRRTKDRIDPDYLVDYEEPKTKITEKRTLSLISTSIEKCKRRMAPSRETVSAASPYANYALELASGTTTTTATTTDKSPITIKRPRYVEPHTGESLNPPITMNLIRTVILQHHCHITKEEELIWFEEGLEWLAQQQIQQNKNNTARYYIEEEKDYTGWDEKRINYQYDLEDLERACEAYFGIPLGLCEDHWAADYLLTQASKNSMFFRRMNLFQHINNNKRAPAPTLSGSNSSRLHRLKRLLFGCFGV